MTNKLAELMAAIDLIATDLEASLTLPAHNGELYARPPAITPELCPLLCVYTERFAWNLMATPSYYIARPDVRIGWFVSSVDSSKHADGFGALAKDAAAIGDKISERITAYSEGVPGQTGTFAKLQETTIERLEGVVLGVVHRLELER